MNRFDMYHPAVLPDPYPSYARLRADDPVHWGMPGDGHWPGTWYILRYDDVMAGLKDGRLGREVGRVLPPERMPPQPPAFKPLHDVAAQWMILRDPPTHTRLRGLVNKAFTPRMVEQLGPSIARVADELLGAALPTGQIELMREFARPLPVLVIAELIGIPPEDFRLFLPWSLTLAATIDLRQNDAVRARGTQAMVELCAYLREIIAARRRQPRADLISSLLAVEDGGSRLSEDEILGTLTLLLTAGNDPVTFMIGNQVLNLLRHPAQLALLRGQPLLLERAVDELLRYDSSVQMTFRFVLEPIELRGKQLTPGDHVALVFGSALRDPEHYHEPDKLDITRYNNKSAFGLGIHFCLGAALARMEGQIALDTLLRRLPELELASETVEWQEAAAVRGPQALPLRFKPA
jgi:cytochrome P450